MLRQSGVFSLTPFMVRQSGFLTVTPFMLRHSGTPVKPFIFLGFAHPIVDSTGRPLAPDWPECHSVLTPSIFPP